MKMMQKKILYIDMDNVLVDFQSAFEHFSEDILKEYEGRLDEFPRIFPKMLPIKDAISSVEKLSEIYDVYILSTAPWDNPSAWTDKLLWIKKYLPKIAYKRLILSHHKNLNCGDFLIDDRTKNGASEFSGEHIHFGTERFPDWDSVVGYLK